MPKPSFAAALLSLFVSPERAEEIEGDLIEQSRSRGGLWYGAQVGQVALALCLRAMAKAPLSVSLIGFAGFIAIWAGIVIGEVFTTSPVGRYLASESDLPVIGFRIAVLALMAAPMGFLTGFALLRLAPVRGAPAALLALLLFIAFLTVLQIYVYPPGLTGTNVLKVCFAGLPLLLGGGVAHRMGLRRRRGGA